LTNSQTASAYKTDYDNTLYRCTGNDSGRQWCCSIGANTTSCCDDENVNLFDIGAPQIINGSVTSTTVLTMVLTKTSCPAASASGAASITKDSITTTTATSMSEGSAAGDGADNMCKNDGDEKTVGLGVGIGMGVPLLAALGAALFFWARERRSHKDLRRTMNDGLEGRSTQAAQGVVSSGGNAKFEHRHELDGAGDLTEMGSGEMQEMAAVGRGRI